MTKPKKIKEKVLELVNEGLSAEKIVTILAQDPRWKDEDIPEPRTIRNWIKTNQDKIKSLEGSEKTLARKHDIKIFRDSEKIMNEPKTVGHINKLSTPDWSIQQGHWPETDHYLWFFSFEGNQYVNPNLNKLCQQWLNAFHNLESSAARHFYIEGNVYAFMPVGYHHYINGTDEEQPEYKKAFNELESLAKKALKAYKKYREGIRQTLYV